MRHATGVAVFAGMLGVTLFGLFLTPLFYVALRRLVLWRADRAGRTQLISETPRPVQLNHDPGFG